MPREVCLAAPNFALHTYTHTLNCYLVTKLQVPVHLVTHLWGTYPAEGDYLPDEFPCLHTVSYGTP
jgi:hypothetical protein